MILAVAFFGLLLLVAIEMLRRDLRRLRSPRKVLIKIVSNGKVTRKHAGTTEQIPRLWSEILLILINIVVACIVGYNVFMIIATIHFAS